MADKKRVIPGLPNVLINRADVHEQYWAREQAIAKSGSGGLSLLSAWLLTKAVETGASDHLDAEGWAPVTAGSRDQAREHPAIKVLFNAQDRLEKIDDRLLEIMDPMLPPGPDWDRINRDPPKPF